MSVWFLYAPGRAERRSCERCLFERGEVFLRTALRSCLSGTLGTSLVAVGQ